VSLFHQCAWSHRLGQMYLNAFFKSDFYELVSLKISWGSKGKKIPISMFMLGPVIGDPFWKGFCEKF
jgi:hypothetical protein